MGINSELEKISNNVLKLKEKSQIIEDIAKLWIDAISNGNKVIFCGNGGSAADSQHLAAELMGKYKLDRNPLPAYSLTCNTSSLTAIGNDYGHEYIFFSSTRSHWTKRRRVGWNFDFWQLAKRN